MFLYLEYWDLEIIIYCIFQVSGDFLTTLSKPFVFSMTNGEIHSAKISRDEPMWSANFKKALALQFQTKIEVSSLNWRQQQTNNVRHKIYININKECIWYSFILT